MLSGQEVISGNGDAITMPVFLVSLLLLWAGMLSGLRWAWLPLVSILLLVFCTTGLMLLDKNQWSTQETWYFVPNYWLFIAYAGGGALSLFGFVALLYDKPALWPTTKIPAGRSGFSVVLARCGTGTRRFAVQHGRWLLPLALAVVLLCFAFVRPGIWRYTYYSSKEASLIGVPEMGSRLVIRRVDRLTGKVEIWAGERWR